MFPGEDEFKREIAAALGDCLEFGYATIDFGVSIINERQPPDPLPQPAPAYQIGRGICVRACKLLRACLDLACEGADTELKILSRSLFETFVAAHFVLLPSCPARRLKATLADLSRDERALLYAGFQTVDRLHALEKTQRASVASQDVRNIDSAKLKSEVDDVENTLGPEWVKQFKQHPFSYSGFSLGDFVDQIGPPCNIYHGTMYAVHSKATHAIDTGEHLTFSDAKQQHLAKWYPLPKAMRGEILIATAMLIGCLELLNKAFNYGEDVGTLIQFSILKLNSQDRS